MTTARAVNRRGEGDRLREEILQAATRLLAGAAARDAVTLRAIGREAGVAAPSIYDHFADRDAILDSLISSTFAKLESACEQAAGTASTGAGRVDAIARAYVAFADRHPSEYRILFERSPANITRPPHAYPEGIRAFQLFRDAFEQMATEGAPAAGDPARDAQALWVALHGVVTLMPATPAFPWVPAQDVIDRLIASFTGASILGG